VIGGINNGAMRCAFAPYTAMGRTPGMMPPCWPELCDGLGVIVFGSVWPKLLATVQGFASIEPRVKDVARVLHLSRAAFIWKIGLPTRCRISSPACACR
jgi:hypothetical protein